MSETTALPYSFILITGATGFVGSQIVNQLLKKGYTVRAPVRTGKLGPLTAAFPAAVTNGQLQLVEFEDLRNVDFDPWLQQGIDAVIHVASGTPGTGKTKSEIIDSSMTGTIGIMQATIRAGIKKFIFTGSMAAMNDLEFKRMFSTDVYNEHSWGPPIKYEDLDLKGDIHSEQQVYAAAKQLSEKKVWELAEQYPDVDVTSIIPPMIYGPYPPNFPIPQHIGSPALVYQLIIGGSKGPRTFPDFPGAHYVDNRDVARAHLLALEARTPTSGVRKRLLVSAGTFHWKDAALLLREKRPDLIDRLPTDETLKESMDMGFAPVDSSLSERVIGLMQDDYIKWEQVVLDTIDMLIQFEQK